MFVLYQPLLIKTHLFVQKHNNLELVVDANGDQKYILSTDVVDQQQVSLSIK